MCTVPELEKLNEEYLDYQALTCDSIPQTVWDSALCYEADESERTSFYRMDITRGYLSELEIPGMNTKRFCMLVKVAKVVLTIPHSNAGEERVFSMIRKIKRDDRGRMNLQGTLSSLLTVKMNMPETKECPCYLFDPPTDVLQKSKKATSFYNKQVCFNFRLTVLNLIRASVDALCRDEKGQISRDPRTKRLLTRRESLAKASKQASNSAFAHL